MAITLHDVFSEIRRLMLENKQVDRLFIGHEAADLLRDGGPRSFGQSIPDSLRKDQGAAFMNVDGAWIEEDATLEGLNMRI